MRAASAEWATGYARQADADFKTFAALQPQPIPQCHQLQFLQMACAKLVKAHLGADGTFYPSLLLAHGGRTFLKRVRGARDRLL